jgi:hypothetical protein
VMEVRPAWFFKCLSCLHTWNELATGAEDVIPVLKCPRCHTETRGSF